MAAAGRQAVTSGSAGTRSLSRPQVLEAAYAILDTEGERAVTIRRVAGRLGVAVTAVYWHVGDKAALFDGLVDLVVERLGSVRARGGDARSRVRSVANALRRALRDRPDLVAFVHRQGRTADLFMPARRLLSRELSDAGLPGPRLVVTLQALLNLVIGSVLLDRQVQRQPEQRWTAKELWGADDVPDPGLLRLLQAPTSEERVYQFMLDALVETLPV